uniref:ARAD1D13046p n=1 Tax=Blastobotrys adeninivorans TaxID=409370 RepID=A0A060T8P7_BLAAD
MSNTAFINRSLTGVRNELEFLKDSGVITDRFYNEVCERLPQRYSEGAPPVDLVLEKGPVSHSSTPAPAPAPAAAPAAAAPPAVPPPQDSQPVAQALYDYEKRDPTDLRLVAGHKVAVLEKMNQDWWRGRDLDTGEEGIFPANYVKMDERAIHSPPPYNEKAQYPPPQPQYSPAPQQQYSPAPPQQSQAGYATYPPPSVNYYPPPMQQPQPMQQPVEQQPQQSSSGHQHLKKFGSKFGNAAIFGAGATVGADIVNSIF